MDKIRKHSHQDVAEQVLQVYTKALQDHKQINSILSEYCILDYFGKIFYEQDKVASQLLLNFHGSNYELVSLKTNEPESDTFEWKPVHKLQREENKNEDLGVGLITSPKCVFPSVSLSTPVRCFSPVSRKRTILESSQKCCNGNKYQKTEQNGEQSSSSKKSDMLPLSPGSFRPLLPDNIKYLTAYGTIRYSNRMLPSMDPKKIKQESLVRRRDRFCQLHIGFECDEHVIGVTNCKIWTIKYSVSSRVTPRNLLSSFNEVDP